MKYLINTKTLIPKTWKKQWQTQKLHCKQFVIFFPYRLQIIKNHVPIRTQKMPKEYFLTLDMLRFTTGALRNIIFYMNNITQELWSTLYFNHCLVVWNISLDKCVSILDISKTESFNL